jgi:signal peptidase I
VLSSRRPLLAAAGVIFVLVAAIVVIFVIRHTGPETKRYYMPARSMEPTIKEGEHFKAEVVDDYEPRRGDVIVFDDPGDWLGGVVKDGHLVKRVIGIPGDTIVCCDDQGRLSVNGEPLDESGYIETGADCAGPMTGTCDWTAGPVPDDGLFVMGDNRANSADSTIHLCLAADVDCDPDRAYVPVGLVRAVVK